MTSAVDVFYPSLPWCVGIRNGVEGGEAPPSKTTTEDDVIRCQLPPPCGCLCIPSLLYDPHQKIQPLGQGSETTVSPKPSREAPGSEEGERSESLFRFRENLRECTGLLSMTSSCRDEVCPLSMRMSSIFLFPPINPFLILLSEG